uniref:Uncharacterized protein n=1 Tax=Solanum lycopersicum TaxID=4081 RepID=A0A3Q7HZD1_SOLLC
MVVILISGPNTAARYEAIFLSKTMEDVLWMYSP